jgi:hypothetical protein
MSRRTVRFFPLPRASGLPGLVEEARAFAERCLRTRGSVPPTMMAITPRGLLIYGPDLMSDENEKDAYALECRLLLVASQATVYMMVLESWMSDAVGGKIPPGPPSKSPRRREVVTICGESRKERRFVIHPIRRTLLGEFTGLGEDTTPAGVEALGRFASLLPPKPVRSQDARKAQLALEAMGVRIETRAEGFSKN